MFDPKIHVWMKRTTDGNGPHPIHKDEVEEYRKGAWELCDAPPALAPDKDAPKPHKKRATDTPHPAAE